MSFWQFKRGSLAGYFIIAVRTNIRLMYKIYTATFNIIRKMAELSTQNIAIQDLHCTISDGRLQQRRSFSRVPGDRFFFSSKIS